jgi:hypothetical protein
MDDCHFKYVHHKIEENTQATRLGSMVCYNSLLEAASNEAKMMKIHIT